MSYVLVYMTAANAREAQRIGKALLDQRLAACVNILGPIRSMYWWEGRVCRGKEIALIAKTRARLVGALTEAVRAVHSYKVPCIVAMKLFAGNADFLAWIGAETIHAKKASRRVYRR